MSLQGLPERHFATFGSSPSTVVVLTVCCPRSKLASNSNFLNDVGEVKFQSQVAPDEDALRAALQKLVKALSRQLQVHVMSNGEFCDLGPRDD
jgi:hypothetical protein